jgi:hypothetical protein
MTPRPAPGSGGPVLLVVAGGAVSHAAIARTAELAAGAPVTVVGVGAGELSRTGSASAWPARPVHPAGRPPRSAGPAAPSPEQVRRTVALAMSVLEDSGVMAAGHIVTGPPGRAVARVARARGARVVILDQPGLPNGAQPPGGPPGGPGTSRAGAGASALMAELLRRMYGSGVVVLAETDRRGGWVSA